MYIECTKTFPLNCNNKTNLFFTRSFILIRETYIKNVPKRFH